MHTAAPTPPGSQPEGGPADHRPTADAVREPRTKTLSHIRDQNNRRRKVFRREIRDTRSGGQRIPPVTCSCLARGRRSPGALAGSAGQWQQPEYALPGAPGCRAPGHRPEGRYCRALPRDVVGGVPAECLRRQPRSADRAEVRENSGAREAAHHWHFVQKMAIPKAPSSRMAVHRGV